MALENKMAGPRLLATILGLSIVYSYSNAQELQLVKFNASNEVNCKLGYFEFNSGDLDRDCCHYYQCAVDGTAGYIRTCMYPTVWNLATCSCGHRSARPECENTPDSCYDEPLADTNCSTKVFDPNLNECCINGEVYTGLEPNVGYMKFGERFPTYCSHGLHFDLEACSCVSGLENNETEAETEVNPECLHWGFDLNFRDDLNSTWVSQGSLRLRGPGVLGSKAYLQANGGPPGLIPYFTKVDLGGEITLSVWYRTQIFEGFLFDNFDERDNASTIEFSLEQASELNNNGGPGGPPLNDAPIGRDNYGRIKLGSGKQMDVLLPGFGGVQNDEDGIELTDQQHSVWNNVIVVLKDQIISLYNNGTFFGSGVDEDETAHGNRLPLALGRNYLGDLDELIMCRFAWTTNQVERYFETGKIPKPKTAKNGDKKRKKDNDNDQNEEEQEP